MKNKGGSNEIDIFKPVIEVFHELCMLTVGVVFEFIKYLWRIISRSPAEIKKIERKALNAKKTTIKENSIGIDTLTKKDIQLDDIDSKKT